MPALYRRHCATVSRLRACLRPACAGSGPGSSADWSARAFCGDSACAAFGGGGGGLWTSSGTPNHRWRTSPRSARVSRRTFYELFADREECLATVVEGIPLAWWSRSLPRLAWRVWRGVSACAGVCSRSWGSWIASQRWRGCWLCRRFVVAHGAGVSRSGPCAVGERRWTRDVCRACARERCTPLTAEGLVGAAFSIVDAWLLRGERRPLTGLLGELMGCLCCPTKAPQ